MIREANDIETAHETAEALRPILLRLTRELRRETEELGVTSRQARLLWLVRERVESSLRELAREEGISAPSLSGHLDRLEDLGLLTRVRALDDRRRVGLALTVEGERVLRRIRARRTTWLAERLRALEPGELAAIDRALPALQALVESAGA
jgi:DNA-binding MarR family transcriptional regulator